MFFCGIVRCASGILLGMVCTAFFSALVVVARIATLGGTALSQRLLALWAWVIRRIVVEGVCGVRVSFKCVPMMGAAAQTEPCIYVCSSNHPSLFAAGVFASYVYAHISARMVAVAKRELFWNPFVGIPLRAAAAGIFIERKRSTYSKEALVSDLKELLSSGTSAALVIFPDMSRPSLKGIDEDCARGRRIPHIWPPYQYTFAPRRRALCDLLEALRSAGVPVRFIDITVISKRDDTSLLNCLWLSGSELCVLGREVEVPHQEELAHFLDRKWYLKNRLIKWVRRV